MPRLYEVTITVRAYALAEDAHAAHEIIEAYLTEIVVETPLDVRIQEATAKNLDPDYRDTPPWAEHGEERTCQQILDAQDLAARQIGLNL